MRNNLEQFSFLSLLFNSQLIKIFRQKQENEREYINKKKQKKYRIECYNFPKDNDSPNADEKRLILKEWGSFSTTGVK